MPTVTIGLYADEDYRDAINEIAWERRVSVSKLTRELFDEKYGSIIKAKIFRKDAPLLEQSLHTKNASDE